MTGDAHPIMIGTLPRSLPRVTVRGVRLATGLVLFAYVLTHLLNHALGNISLDAMEEGLVWAKALWWNPVGQAALYGSLAAHLGLGLWALYRRRPFRYRPSEAWQLALGLLIPLLLLQHIVATRLAFDLHGIEKGYAQQLYKYVVDAPAFGVLQAVTLLVVWVHGSLGIYLWLRLKPFFPRIAGPLLGVAVLAPALALLGYAQGGRAFLAIMADPDWRAANLNPVRLGTAAQVANLNAWRDGLTLGYAALVALTLLARFTRRALEARRGLVAFTYPSGRTARVPGGTSVLEASRLNRIPHASVCGGRGRCSTCRVRVYGPAEDLPEASAAEQAVLDRVGAGPGVRLACQLRPEGDVTVAPLISPKIGLDQTRHLDSAGFGEERFVVAMFVDMRGSTRLAERRLPFDTVFLINRFLEAVGSGVVAAGGQPNAFLGDGMMALFGVDVDAREAARRGLAAVGLVGANVEALNAALGADLDEPIRFGIGLHAGTAILGEIGDRENARAVFTAIGDPVNVASRLQGLTKRVGCEALVSDAVFAAAGIVPDLPVQEVEIDGREGRLMAYPIRRAREPWAELRPAA